MSKILCFGYLVALAYSADIIELPDDSISCAAILCEVGNDCINGIGCVPAPVASCGGIAGIQCADGLECVDDPRDTCDPNNGGADCGGVCIVATPSSPDCSLVRCAEPQCTGCSAPNVEVTSADCDDGGCCCGAFSINGNDITDRCLDDTPQAICGCSVDAPIETYCCLGEEISGPCVLCSSGRLCFDIDTECTEGPCQQGGGKGPKGGKGGKGKGRGRRSNADASDLVFDPNDNGIGDKSFYNIFGMEMSFIDLILATSNVVLVVICLVMAYVCCCKKNKTKPKYVRTPNDEIDEESKALC